MSNTDAFEGKLDTESSGAYPVQTPAGTPPPFVEIGSVDFPPAIPEGLTEENLMGPMEQQPQPGFIPVDRQVLDQIEYMQYEHAKRNGSGEMKVISTPGQVDLMELLKAQARFIREQTFYFRNSNRRDITTDQYIGFLARYNYEQQLFIDAQMRVLHQFGAV